MSRQRLAAALVAGLGLASAAVYSTRKSGHEIDKVRRRRAAQEAHEGITSARVAGNETDWTTPHQAAPSRPDRNPRQHGVDTPDGPDGARNGNKGQQKPTVKGETLWQQGI
ncbi:uncharacterized protein MAM_07614 [Metarhizium album ARSEF 1941]|uniref:Uncharacterized protein n=1 Tax=Metarhizium album (strain ARSEF 1941) TaxID=1081103 RepID=A0A0B2WLJ1_METAS|nr:uncharacterized protein MAM_07614 [Metarhizium album ARSEF 1941]KHN94559.1 hypothetical protein MAM_07614 [Metarhizium album ARSEF 1941]